MPHLTLKDSVRIFYKDWGPKDAQPVVFHHGWPLSADEQDLDMPKPANRVGFLYPPCAHHVAHGAGSLASARGMNS